MWKARDKTRQILLITKATLAKDGLNAAYTSYTFRILRVLIKRFKLDEKKRRACLKFNCIYSGKTSPVGIGL